MDGPVLRYSLRTRLIREAEQHGIGRFEANLIIAAVQHEAGERTVTERVEQRSSRVQAIVAFCLTQGAIVAGVWWMIAS